MKFCTKCGHEMVDEAIVCTGCGCATAPIPKKSRKPTKAGNNLNLYAYNFVFSIFTAICLFCLLLARFEYNLSIVALIFSIASLGFGIASFAVSMFRCLRVEIKFSSITRLVIGCLLFIASIVFICCLC